MDVLGWVDNVPDNMVLWISTVLIIKEARAQVTRVNGIGEAVSGQVAGKVAEECLGIIW